MYPNKHKYVLGPWHFDLLILFGRESKCTKHTDFLSSFSFQVPYCWCKYKRMSMYTKSELARQHSFIWHLTQVSLIFDCLHHLDISSFKLRCSEWHIFYNKFLMSFQHSFSAWLRLRVDIMPSKGSWQRGVVNMHMQICFQAIADTDQFLSSSSKDV